MDQTAQAVGPFEGEVRGTEHESLLGFVSVLSRLATQRLFGMLDDFLEDFDNVESPLERDVLRSLVLASAGQRDALRRFQEVNLRDESVEPLLAGVLLCEVIDSRILEMFLKHHLAVSGNRPSLVASLRSFSLELISQSWPADDLDATSGVKGRGLSLSALKTDWSREMIRAVSGLSRLATAELVATVDVLQRSSRYDHLAGKAVLPYHGSEVAAVLGSIPNVLAEVSLRRTLDWAHKGEWVGAVLSAESIVWGEGYGAAWKTAAASIAEYCGAQNEPHTRAARTTSEAGGELSSAGPLSVFALVFASMAAGEEPMRVLESIEAEEISKDADPLLPIVVTMCELMAADERAAAVDIGSFAESLRSGGTFERSIAFGLRVLQMHVLMLRGRFEHALRVARYLPTILPGSGVSAEMYKFFIERDVAALTMVTGGER